MKMGMKKRIALFTLVMMMVSSVAYGFSDVKEYMWYYEDISIMKDKGIINGYTDGTFRPDNSLTNAEALKLITKVVGIKEKETKQGDHWAKGVIEASVEKGIIKDKNISFNEKVTRLEISGMLVKALNLQDKEVKLDKFKDTNAKYANILHSIDVIVGVGRPDGVYFNPDNDITRAEMATIIVRVEKYINKHGILEEEEIIDEIIDELPIDKDIK